MGGGEQNGVESIQNSAVAGHDSAEVFNAKVALERRLAEVTDLPQHAENRPENQGVNQWNMEPDAAENGGHRSERQPADRALDRLLR